MRLRFAVLFALSLLPIPVAAVAAPAGKVVIAQGVDPSTLDMMNQSEQPASNVGAQMFDMLVERDQSLKLVPGLAAELPMLVAPTTWEIKLRKGVKFHNGEDFNAESVKFSLERLSNPANKMRGGSSLNGPQGRYVRDREVAEAVTGQLTKAGIRTTLRTHELVAYLNNMVYVHMAGPVWLIGWGHPTMDAEAIYVPLFKAPGIFVNWDNPDFNGMTEEAQGQMDEKKRLALYHRINKLWIEEAPAVPLYQQIDLYGANKRLAWKARSDELIRAYDMALKSGQ
jgi:ABC-type transport system substrate-binding protein